MNHFHNTVALDPDQLEIFDKNVENQEKLILGMFRTFKSLSPWKAYWKCKTAGKNFPITSVRRSISNLEKEGKLTKTDDQVMGPYGVKEYVWKLK